MCVIMTTIRPDNWKSDILSAVKKPHLKVISIILHNENEMVSYGSIFSISFIAPLQHNIYKIVASNLKEQ